MITTRTRVSLAIAATTAVTLGLGPLAFAAPAPVPDAAAAQAALSTEEAADLQFMREEERLARDLYAALAAAYDDARPFNRITLGEQTHFERMGSLLIRYNVSDPAANATAGSYSDAQLQQLYNDLLARGLASWAEALAVGAAVEELDIADLADAIAATDTTDLDDAYSDLKAASEQHLLAFTRDDRTAGRNSGGNSTTSSDTGYGRRFGRI